MEALGIGLILGVGKILTRIARIARNPIIDFQNPIIAIIGFRRSIIAIRAIRVARFGPQKVNYCNPSNPSDPSRPVSSSGMSKIDFRMSIFAILQSESPFFTRDGPRKSDIGLGGGGSGFYFSAPKRVGAEEGMKGVGGKRCNGREKKNW